MPRTLHRLNPLRVSKLTGSGLYADGGDFESYFPSKNIALLDMHLIDIMDAANTELAQLETEMAQFEDE